VKPALAALFTQTVLAPDSKVNVTRKNLPWGSC